jgi:phosphoglycerate dehydrogenase-like enzyme
MTEPIHVLVLTQSPLSEALLAPVRAAAPRLVVEHRTAKTLAELGEVWAEVEVLYTTNLLPAPEQAPRLKWVQGHWAGVDSVIAHPLVQRVTLTTASGVHASNLAEYVLMMMLAWGHHLPRMLEHQRRAEWPEQRWQAFVPRELRGATVGIVGYGSIGREVARLARAFGMRVLAVKREAGQRADEGWQLSNAGDASGALADRVYASAELRAMLPECDYVALILPLTPETHHLIGAEALRAMKREAVLINIGRGAVVDEAALIAALQNGVIGGAALDVFEREPLPADSPLWKLPNVILSPHVGGFTPEYDARAMQLFAENLRRYAQGERLMNVVEVKRGY